MLLNLVASNYSSCWTSGTFPCHKGLLCFHGLANLTLGVGLVWGVGIIISKVAKAKIYNLVVCKMECTVVFNTSMEGFSQKKKK